MPFTPYTPPTPSGGFDFNSLPDVPQQNSGFKPFNPGDFGATPANTDAGSNSYEYKPWVFANPDATQEIVHHFGDVNLGDAAKGLGHFAQSVAQPFTQGIGSAIRGLQSIPSVFREGVALAKGNQQAANAAGAESTKIQEAPILGQRTFPGSTPLQNVGSAAQAGSFLIGGEAAGAVGSQAVKQAAIAGTKVGAIQGAGQYLTNTDKPTVKGTLENTAIGAAGGAALGAGAGAAGKIAGGLAKAGSKVGEAASKVDARLGGEASAQAEKVNASKLTPELQKTWKLVQPELTKSQQATAVKAGKIQPTGLLKTLKQVPTGEDVQLIKTAHPYVTGAKNEVQAVANMQKGIADEANSLRAGLKQSDAIWNVNDLKGKVNAIEKPHQLSGDLEKAFNKTMSVVLDKAGKADRNLSGLLDVRQALDQEVEKQYPNLYQNERMTPIKQAIMDTRRAINDLIEQKLPAGKTASGMSFKNSLKKQSLLYQAIDNTASKTKVGTNVISRFTKAHPIVTGVAGLSAGSTALGAAGKKVHDIISAGAQ